MDSLPFKRRTNWKLETQGVEAVRSNLEIKFLREVGERLGQLERRLELQQRRLEVGRPE